MKIRLGKRFEKAYKVRITSNKRLILRVKERIDSFKANPKNPILKDHGLSGVKRQLRAFSITGDIRLVYQPISEDEVIFLDIGSHTQVY